MPLLPATEWDSFLANHPRVHLLQTTAWGNLKSEFGWEVERILSGGSGAQALFRRLPLGFSLAYIPKGPVGGIEGENPPQPPLIRGEKRAEAWGALLAELDALCRRRRTILLKVEPDMWREGGNNNNAPPGFRTSSHSIQPPRTIVVNLQGDEDAILARMKQKTRYNIRLALKRNVIVRPSSDLDLFYKLIERTGERGEFGVHSQEYYQRAFDLFHPRGNCQLLVAEFEREPLAAIIVFTHGKRAWYFYGASSDQHRHLMPTYLLQWEAMRWARDHGCTEYDLWGVPDEDEEILEDQFPNRKDGLWSVYRFKRGFGGELRRALGPWDRVYQPVMYAFYRWWVGRRELG